ncbi:thiol:disulfide interchange protein precursor [Afipia felis]|uniref:Thiol:disulfide interchange protein n=1 Tax=Afipia felis TaxID=1035 RepID=A0A090MSE7_AFIFE|nr:MULTISPECIES: protein-disulfide reductase DsbD domain-containing protein [Afipia]EFI51398.1 hypothetical protein AfiDRAFT_2771 [Afipia sp. 1NLS2]CEG09142.1 thiol:disulfide interchange protein precursor [Afipia felis]
MSHSRKLRNLLVILPIAALATTSAFGATPDDLDQRVKFSVERDDESIGLELTWIIAPKSFLYRDTIKVTIDGRPLRMVSAPGLRVHPSISPTKEIYRGIAMANIIEDIPEKGEIRVTYQRCEQNATCDPPVTQSIDLETLSIHRLDERELSSATDVSNARQSRTLFLNLMHVCDAALVAQHITPELK